MASPATGKKSTTQRWACLKSTANFSPKLNIVLTDPTTSPVRVEISIQRRNWKRLLALEKKGVFARLERRRASSACWEEMGSMKNRLSGGCGLSEQYCMMSGSKGLSPTYEQAHVGLDFLTLASLYIGMGKM